MTKSRVPSAAVRSVLIPLTKYHLLLPNVVVAEVMNYTKPEVRQGAPDWLCGDITWRGTSVPVVSIEGILGNTIVEPVHRGRTIILNTLNGKTALPHIGVVAQSIPSLVHVTSESIQASDTLDNSGGLVRQAVIIDDIHAFIPDLNELERLVLEYPATD